MENNQGVDDGGMKALEGYFNNLSAAAFKEKSVFEHMVANNTKIAANNKNLAAIVKN